MTTATELRDELHRLNVLPQCFIDKYSEAELETLIAGIREKTSRIGEKVRRGNVSELYSQYTGTIIQIEGNRARVQWDDKKTWYRLDKLLTVKPCTTA